MENTDSDTQQPLEQLLIKLTIINDMSDKPDVVRKLSKELIDMVTEIETTKINTCIKGAIEGRTIYVQSEGKFLPLSEKALDHDGKQA